MEDSFFGFDTSVPLDDDGGGRIAEPSEEEYDALNDETFGSAINGDWEEVHENLVRMTGESDNDGDGPDSGHVASGGNALRNSRFNKICDSDLELNLSGMKLDDVDINYDGGDSESIGGSFMGDMHPSVWSLQPATKEQLRPNAEHMQLPGARMSLNPAAFLRERFSSPFSKQQPPSHPQYRMMGPPQPHRQTPVNTHMPPGIPFGLPYLPRMPNASAPPNICTLEDIERNIMMQQSASKQELQKQGSGNQEPPNHQQLDAAVHQQHLFNDALKQREIRTPTPIQQPHSQQHQQQQFMMQQQQQHLTQKMMQKVPPGGFPITAQQSPPRPSSNFANNLAQHPFGNLMQQQQQQQQPQQQPFTPPQNNGNVNRLNPGYYFPQAGPHPQLPPHPLLNQHGMSNNFPNQRSLPNPHLPVALNNFAMHPNFNAMRAAACAAGIHPAALLAQQQQSVAAAAAVANRIPGHPPNPMMLLNNQSSSNASINMFNMRLLQEIQQNHPLLQNPARLAQQQQHPNMTGQNNANMQLPHSRGNNNVPGGNLKQQNHNHNGRRDGSGNGNLPHEEYDEYANLMSTRDKHWLIGIQLSQLNTDTPYIDDYYYTVYKERKAAKSGSMRHSQAHKDNQLNHPLTQPKGHAQLIMVQLGNKNGTRNGQQRERHNSDNHNNNQDVKLPMYVFTPLKFENSLGKLQYCSVTAPRKIIDAEIMNNESSSTCSNNSVSDNNTANANGGAVGATASTNIGEGDQKSDTSALSQASANNAAGPGESQRKSRYILLHIETLYRLLLKLDDLNNPNAIATILMKKKKESERMVAMEQLENANKTPEERAIDPTSNPSLKSKFNYEIETKEALIEKVVAGLQHDKVVAMMNVRKGKVLIRRLMPYIEEHDARWNVWIGVFSSLQNVFKKDRDDADGILYSLYPDFKKQIKKANLETIVTISSAITLNEKKSNGVFCSKFGISSLVILIQQAETIYDKNEDATLSEQNKNSWRLFLDQVANALNRTIQNQTICAAIESDSIQPIMNHFARFKDLKLDSLLALITEAKQQIN